MTASLSDVSSPSHAGVFVGRARELEILECGLDGMELGSGATVLVAGEAGIGKTRLVSELGGRARDVGFGVLLGRSIDLVGTELPYQPSRHSGPLGQPWRAEGRTAGSQLRVFEETFAVLLSPALLTEVITLAGRRVDEGPAEWRRLVDQSGAIAQPVRDEPLRVRSLSRRRSVRTRRGSVQRGDALPSSRCNARALAGRVGGHRRPRLSAR